MHGDFKMDDPTVKGLYPLPNPIKGADLNILIIHTRWNLQALVDGAKERLLESHVLERNIHIKSVPGAFELPYACLSEAKRADFDAIIAIGVLIKGSTMHFEYIADAVSHGIMRVGLDCSMPVIFGVLTCLNEEQAYLRAGLKYKGAIGHNHGIDWALAAVEMAQFRVK